MEGDDDGNKGGDAPDHTKETGCAPTDTTSGFEAVCIIGLG